MGSNVNRTRDQLTLKKAFELVIEYIDEKMEAKPNAEIAMVSNVLEEYKENL